MAEKNFYNIIPDSISDLARLYYQAGVGLEEYQALRDSMSYGQMQSKIRCLQTLQDHNIKSETALFIGHWHGLLPNLMKRMGVIQSAVGYEKSEKWSQHSQVVNSWWNWTSQLRNIEVGEEKLNGFDLITNTSCEHMSDKWIEKVPSQSLVLAQSTDYQHPEHINIVGSLQEFTRKFANFEILAATETKLEIYNRFTVLVRKN